MKNLIQTEWRLLLFGLLMTFWSAPGQTFFLSLFSGEIRASLDLSHSQFGGLYSAANLLSAVIIVWSGSLIDRVALRRFACFVIIALAASTFLLSMANSVLMLLLAIFLLRQFGQSLMMITATTTLVRYMDENKGKASALGGMGYHLAEALMPSIIIFLIASIGWRASLQSTSVFLLLLVLPLAWLLLNTHRQRHRSYLSDITDRQNEALSTASTSVAKKQWTRSEVIRDKRFYLFMPAFLAQTILFTGFIFHQIHLIDSKGWSLTLWGSLFIMYAAVSIVSKLVTGVVVDKIGAVRMVPYAALPLGLGLLLLSLSSHIAVAVAFLFLMGITTGVQTTVSGPFWSQMYGSRNLGSIKSLASALVSFASALAPFGMGWLIDDGVSIEVLAAGGMGYIFLATGIALYGRYLYFKDPANVSL